MSTARRSLSVRRSTAGALAILAAVGLAGCSLVEVAPPAPLTGIAKCVLGNTWSLDTAALATAMQAELATRAITATAAIDGSQTLTWALDGKVALDTDYTLTLTSGAEDNLTVVTDKHSGKATGIAYINAEVAIPRDWDATGLNVDTTATVKGVAAETLPYTLVQTDIDDSVGVELTCDGGTMTTHQRGSDLTLTWAKK
ncbi:MAG: hypothetical protein JWR04_2694 [Rhodoglobus sp.]|nr:hypothetical protein [Rhodoglobus sp.]